MSDALYPKRSAGNSDDNLIPLINIVFLLLVFFMVAGQISSITDPGIEAPMSESQKPVEAAELELVMKADGSLILGGQPLVLDGLQPAVQDAIVTASEVRVALKADRSVKASDLDPVLTVFREQGVSTITLHTVQAEQL